MKKFRPLSSILIILLLVLILSSSISAAGPEAQWVAMFYSDIPAGTWAEGTHTYSFEFTWTEPSPGFAVSAPGEFTVSADAPIYDGYVLLRSFYELAYVPPGCQWVDVIHPDQPTRFQIGWRTDDPMTPPEALAHLRSMSVTAVWGDGSSVALDQASIFRWSEKREEGLDRYLCAWTTRR